MTMIARAAEYRYFSFTYFLVRLISVWLKVHACKAKWSKHYPYMTTRGQTGHGFFCTIYF